MRWSWRQAAVVLLAAVASAAAADPTGRRLLFEGCCSGCLAAQPTDPAAAQR